MGCRDQSRVRARWCAAAVIFAVGDLLDAPDKLLRLWENSPKCFAGRPSPPESCPCGPFCPKGIPLLQTNQSPKIKTQSLGFYTIRGILTFLRQARPSMARNKGLPQNLQLHPSNGWVPAAPVCTAAPGAVPVGYWCKYLGQMQSAASHPVPAFGPQFQKQYSGQVHS